LVKHAHASKRGAVTLQQHDFCRVFCLFRFCFLSDLLYSLIEVDDDDSRASSIHLLEGAGRVDFFFWFMYGIGAASEIASRSGVSSLSEYAVAVISKVNICDKQPGMQSLHQIPAR
jgi:hypothetical protein